jgi:hypothetical protein
MPEWQRRVGRIWEMKETPIVGSTSQNGQIPVQLFTIFMGWVNIKQKGGSTWSRIYMYSLHPTDAQFSSDKNEFGFSAIF